jgi:hypothetical protein
MTTDFAIAVGAAAGLITAFAHAFVVISKELRAWRTLRRRNAPRLGAKEGRASSQDSYVRAKSARVL